MFYIFFVIFVAFVLFYLHICTTSKVQVFVFVYLHCTVTLEKGIRWGNTDTRDVMLSLAMSDLCI